MVRTFVGLKLRLVANGFRLGWQQKLGLVLGIVYAVPLALGGFVLLASVRGEPELARPAAIMVFSLLFMGWLVGPLLGFGSDETLDPARLALLPLPRRQLAAGLFAASSVGIGAVATAVVLAGAVVGLAPPGPGAVVVVAAVGVQFALCVTGARALTTALSGALRSRRGRDLTVLVGVFVAVVVPQSFRLFTDVGREGLETLAGALAWTPPGLAARAALDAGSGALVPATVALVGAAVVALLFAWWWVTSLDRSLTTTAPTGGARARRRSPGLFAPAWAWLPRDRRGAVAAKELRYYGRDPRQRAGTLVWMVSAFALPVGVALSDLGDRREIVLAACAFAALGGLASINQYGFEGGAHWMNVVAGTDVHADLSGKNLALAAWVLAVVGAVAVALAAVSGGWVWVPVAVGVSMGVLGVAIGVGNVISVRAPQPMPDSATNLFAANANQGCTSGLLQLLAITVQWVLLVPVALGVAAALAWWPPAMAVVVAVALGWGYLCWRSGLAYAVRWLEPRQTELLEALSPRRAG